MPGLGFRWRRAAYPEQRLGIELVQDDAGFHDGCPRVRVDRDDAVAVLGPVDDDRHVARLPGQARPAAARDDRRSVPPADFDRRRAGLDGARHHRPDRYLPVVHRVGAVGAPAPGVETHFTVGLPPQVRLEDAGHQVKRWRSGTADDGIGQREQEPEQDLHAQASHPQFLEQLSEITVIPLRLGFLPRVRGCLRSHAAAS
jgi:hypothetical protein